MKRAFTTSAAALTLAMLVTAGCGGGDAADDRPAGQPSTSTHEGTQSPTPIASSTSATQSARRYAAMTKAAVPTVTKAVQITEDNDPNSEIGRPNGYTDAAVLYDLTVSCTELGVDCGATIEIWPTSKEARARAVYIQGILKDAPVLGAEYDYLNGPVLLRVAGDIKPSKAKAYGLAFGGEPYSDK